MMNTTPAGEAKLTGATLRGVLGSVILAGSLAFSVAPARAQEPDHSTHGTQSPASQPRASEEHSEHVRTPDRSSAAQHDAEAATAQSHEQMAMGSMQGGRAPPDARDPHAYSEGLSYSGMPGLEQSDRIAFGTLRADEFEGLSGNEGDGFAWSIQGSFGNDDNKLWFRTQGLKVPGELDPTTSGEVLWWRPLTAFWATQLGVRQDFGAGSHTYLAAGVQGLAPYWFEIEATSYVGDDGRLSARLKGAYDILFTNRLILTTGLETNLYSKAEEERGLGSGLGNVELGLRLRYEFSRKVAPYAGYVWERSFGETADLRRAEGDPVNEHRFVAGVRMWW